jgi:molecular chaperone DnaK
MARDNRTLGRFQLIGLPPAPRGVPQIEVTFDIDANGIVNVTARDQATGQSTGVQINPAGGLSQDEIERLVNEAAEHQRADAVRRDIRMLQNKLEGMIYTNEKVFREFGKLLNDEDRDKVQKIINRSKESASAEEKSRLNDAIFELQSASRILTGVMLYNPMKSGVSTDTPTSWPGSMERRLQQFIVRRMALKGLGFAPH